MLCATRKTSLHAIQAVSPGIRSYRCVEHLRMSLIERLRTPGLYDRRRSLAKTRRGQAKPVR